MLNCPVWRQFAEITRLTLERQAFDRSNARAIRIHLFDESVCPSLLTTAEESLGLNYDKNGLQWTCSEADR